MIVIIMNRDMIARALTKICDQITVIDIGL